MSTNERAVSLMGLGFFVLLCWAAVDAFGWLHGLGIVGAVWLLAPYRQT